MTVSSLVRRTVVVLAVSGCVAGVVWMYRDQQAGGSLAGRADIVGGLAGVAALVLALVALWPRRAAAAGSEAALAAAVEYLACETLSAWRAQARARRVTTPAPALVSWCWAGPDVAAPAVELGPPTLLTEGEVTRLRELYQGLPGPGRVVILGGPGAGKTTAMLLLLIDVLAHRPVGATAPVPMWLTLGGFRPEIPFHDWIVTVLNRDYPGLIAHAGRGTAAELLRSHRIALFLDGLDELPDGLRGPALQAINEAAQELPVVLTSRPDEYRAATGRHRLWNAAVVDLRPVDIENACTFLLNQQVGARRDAWQAVAQHLRRHPDSVAARTLRDPLALNLARDTYTHTDAAPTDLLHHSSPEALRRHLLARVLTLAYPGPGEYAHAVGWLTWIADRLDGGRDIRWWDIPSWTHRKPRNPGLSLSFVGGVLGGFLGFVYLPLGPLLVGLGTGLGLSFLSRKLCVRRGVDVRRPTRMDRARNLAVALLGGFLGGQLVMSDSWSFDFLSRPGKWLAVGVVVGLFGRLAGNCAAAIVAERTDEPRVVNVRRPSLRELVRITGIALTAGSIFGFPMGMWAWSDMASEELVAALVIWLAVALVAGFMLLLDLWSDPVQSGEAVTPVRSHRADRRRSAVVGVAGGLVFGLVAGALAGLVTTLTHGLVTGYGVGLVAGPLGGLGFGLAAMRGAAHSLASVEARLAVRNRPVRFMTLLRIAAERQVLRQAGAVYQFRHAALQDLLGTDKRFRPARGNGPDRPAPSRNPIRTRTARTARRSNRPSRSSRTQP